MKETRDIKRNTGIPGKNSQKERGKKKQKHGKGLQKQQDQCSTRNIESATSNDTLVEILVAINSNNFDKDLENSVITNSPTTEQESDHCSSENLSY